MVTMRILEATVLHPDMQQLSESGELVRILEMRRLLTGPPP